MSDETQRKLLKGLTDRAQQKLIEKDSGNDFLFEITKKLRNSNYDKKIFDLITHHLTVLKEAFNKSEEENLDGFVTFETSEECMLFCISKLFFEKLIFISNEAYPITISYTDPIVALPVEVFSEPDDDAKSHFEKNLKRSDVLYAEMLNPDAKINDKDLLEVRIIGKVCFQNRTENTELVYQLNIHAYMFKNLELQRLGVNKISPNAVLKVTYMGCINTDPVKHFVTSNIGIVGHISEELSSLTLGLVSVNELPFDFELLKLSSQYSSYAHFLRNHPDFHRSYNLKELIQSIGINPNRIYSLSEKRDGLTIPTHNCIEQLKTAANIELHDDSLKHLEIAKTCIEKSNYRKAESEIKKALKWWPKNYRAYEMRGEMYKKQKKRSSLEKAVLDFETALSLNPSASIAKQELSNIFLYLANRNKSKFEKAKGYATRALEINSENHQAIQFLQRVDKRIASKISIQQKADAMDLDSLEKQKKELEKCLKKETR